MEKFSNAGLFPDSSDGCRRRISRLACGSDDWRSVNLLEAVAGSFASASGTRPTASGEIRSHDDGKRVITLVEAIIDLSGRPLRLALSRRARPSCTLHLESAALPGERWSRSDADKAD